MPRNVNTYDTYIKRAINDFPQVPSYIVKAVIAAESSFNPKAYREEPKIKDASRGLMQLLAGTARAIGYYGDPEGLFSPGVNIYYGTKLLSQNYAKAGNWPDAISAYNGGFRPHLGFGSPVRQPGVRCMGRTIPVGNYCNQRYVDKVLSYAAYYAGREGIAETALPFSGARKKTGNSNSNNSSSGNPVVFSGFKGFLTKLAIKHVGGVMFKGWKTKAGAVLAAIGGIVGALAAFEIQLPTFIADIWQQIVAVGAALGIYGVRDKQERDNPKV